MRQPELLRRLNLADGHLSAASGLVRVAELLYVVADDELHLGLFELAEPGPGRLLRLLPGKLPAPARARKAVKPDLEVLMLLPDLGGEAQATLLALGSGSTLGRQRGVLLGLAQGSVPRSIDLAPWYEPLREHFRDLNIEGGFLLDAELILLQRGNQGLAANAAVHYAWTQVEAWLCGEAAAPLPQAIQSLQLGVLDGVALGFTDGVALSDGRWLFSAVAENTGDSYNDGACMGAVIGLVQRDGQVRRLAQLDGSWKVEGIALAEDGSLLLVTDGDDPQVAASLLRLPLSML